MTIAHQADINWTNPAKTLPLFKDNFELDFILLIYFNFIAIAQIEFNLKSKLSSNTDTEAELSPSVLENLDTSGLNFIPVLRISPVTSPTSTAAKPGNKHSEQNEEENTQSTGTGTKAKEEDINIASELTKDLDKFKHDLKDNTSTPLASGGNGKRSKELTSADLISSTPLHRTILSRLESTPEGAMVSANSSGFFGLSDFDDSSVNFEVNFFLLWHQFKRKIWWILDRHDCTIKKHNNIIHMNSK